jgi:hypothetical protein
MLKIFRLITLIFIFSLTVFSQNKNDLQKSNLRKKVHQVNYYDVYQSPKSNQPNSTERSLSGTAVFNRKGNLRVRFEFSRNGKDCSYKKTVYSYDEKTRKKSAALYESDTGENICPNTPPLFQENKAENLDGRISFVEKTIYEYEPTGKISREIVFDRDNRIVQQNNYTYNRRGEQVRYTITQQKNRISGSSGRFVKTLDFRMFYRDNGKTKETYRYEDGKLIQRDIDYTDKQKRSLRGELYKLEADAQNNIVREIIGFRTKSFYDGNKELFSWTIYNQNRDLETQLYILSENDNELMRLEYNHRNQVNETNQNGAEKLTHYQFENVRPEIVRQLKYILKFDECVESPDWIPARFETRSYKFDTNGNITRYSSQKRETPSKELKDELVREQDLIYYK